MPGMKDYDDNIIDPEKVKKIKNLLDEREKRRKDGATAIVIDADIDKFGKHMPPDIVTEKNRDRDSWILTVLVDGMETAPIVMMISKKPNSNQHKFEETYGPIDETIIGKKINVWWSNTYWKPKFK